MHFRSLLPVRLPSRRASLGLSLIVFASTLGSVGCMDYSLTSLYVEPSAGACIYPGGTVQFTAYGTYTKGGHTAETKNITSQVSWSTDLPDLATVNSSGLVLTNSNGIGLTNVKASAAGEFGVVWGSAPVTVKTTCVSGSNRTMSAIRILPGDQNLAGVGDTSQLVAVGRYTAAPLSSEITSRVTWASSDPQIVKVTPDGLLTAVGTGEATITASQTNELGQVVMSTEKIHVGSGSEAP